MIPKIYLWKIKIKSTYYTDHISKIGFEPKNIYENTDSQVTVPELYNFLLRNK